MPLTHENTRLFWKLFASYIKKVLMKNLKFVFFSTHVPITLINLTKSLNYTQIHPANPTNPEIHYKILISKML